jgi:hypothetical protein
MLNGNEYQVNDEKAGMELLEMSYKAEKYDKQKIEEKKKDKKEFEQDVPQVEIA